MQYNLCNLCYNSLTPTSASFLTCHKGLMRATKAVKQLLFDSIDKVEVGGVSEWSTGLTLAFKTLAETTTTANCEKAVIIMSDETGQPIDVGCLLEDVRIT